MITQQAHIGSLGERAAVRWLRERGYLICELNWRAGRYEIDIIAEKWGTTHFVEVKTRRAQQEGGLNRAEDALTQTKLRSLMKAARSYIAQRRDTTGDVQFDLIAVDITCESISDIRLYESVI